MPAPYSLAATFAAAFLLSIALSLVWRAVVLRLGHTAPADPLHSSRTALSAGVAVAIAAFTATVGQASIPWPVWTTGAAYLALGLWDDVRALHPGIKLVPQLAIAAALVASGSVLPIGPLWLAAPVSILWIASAVNAFNFIDNMDGIASGSAAAAALVAGVLATYFGQAAIATAALAVGGASLGFYLLNFPPAKMFLGDCGSMFIGGFLAEWAIVFTQKLNGVPAGPVRKVLVVALLLYVPLINLVFITVVRRLEGTPLAHGIADHVNYRMLALGISPRRIAVMIPAATLLIGAISLAVLALRPVVVAPLSGIFAITTLYLALFLSTADVSPFRRGFARSEKSGQGQSYRLRSIRRAAYAADLLLIPITYLTAFLARWDMLMPLGQRKNLMLTMPILLLLRIAALRLFGLYDFFWAYAGMDEVVRLLLAVGSSSALLVVTAMFLNVRDFSRGVIVIDAVLAMVLLGFTRFGLLMFQHLITSAGADYKKSRVLIVGAGDAGVAMLAETRRNRALGLKAVGFVDDDHQKRNLSIHGVRVISGICDLSAVAAKTRARIAIIAIPSLAPQRRREIEQQCRDAGMRFKTFQLALFDEPEAASRPDEISQSASAD